MLDWASFDEAISSDSFLDTLERIEDKIMEQGSLSDLLGNEYTFSLSVTRESNEITVQINLFPEDEVNLGSDEIDNIGDYAVSKVSEIVLDDLLKQSNILDEERDIIANVLLHGERPVVE